MEVAMHKKHIGYIVRTLANKLSAHLVSYETMRGYDEVTAMHGWILAYLYENSDKVIYQKDIEANFDMCRSTTTGVLKSMEQHGYITREADKYDARLKKLILTPLGKETHLKIFNDLDFLDEAIKYNITKEDLDTFLKVISIIEKNIDDNMKFKFKNLPINKNSIKEDDLC